MKAYKIIIQGDLFNKGFRFTSMEMAYKYGVKGFVQFQNDGSVLIEAEGELEPLAAYIDWCQRGPARGIVEEMKLEEIEVQNFISFDIIQSNRYEEEKQQFELEEKPRRSFLKGLFRLLEPEVDKP